MATFRALQFELGETWLVNLACVSVTGAPLDLTGGSVEMIVNCVDGTILGPITAAVPTPTNGIALFQFDPDNQPATAQFAGFECRAIASDGTISEQAYGVITITPSLFEAA